MSYRYHLNIVPKELMNLIKNAQTEEDLRVVLMSHCPQAIDIDDASSPVFAFENIGEEFFCFGKNSELFDAIAKKSIPLFKNETDPFYIYEGHICGKKAMLAAIDTIRKFIVRQYGDLLVPAHEPHSLRTEEKLTAFAQEKMRIWSKKSELNPSIKTGTDEVLAKQFDDFFLPYNTDLSTKNIINSNLWEYTIFELVRKFKELDFENNVILLIGW